MRASGDIEMVVAKKGVTLTRRAKPVGRPLSRLNVLKVVQTRVPVPMYKYCKILYPAKYRTLTEMFEDMVSIFREERPWKIGGLHWRKPKAAITYHDGEVGKTGWEQINIHLDAEIKKEVSLLCKTLGVSMATFCYTAIYWWIVYKHPPNHTGQQT